MLYLLKAFKQAAIIFQFIGTLTDNITCISFTEKKYHFHMSTWEHCNNWKRKSSCQFHAMLNKLTDTTIRRVYMFEILIKGPFIYLMTDFPTLSYTSNWEISTLSYTWSLEGGSPFRWGLPRIGHYREYLLQGLAVQLSEITLAQQDTRNN